MCRVVLCAGCLDILKDHLGSTDVILDDNGEVEQRVSFDPWGAKRNPDWSYQAKVLDSLSSSGFTGHENIDAVGLIHMNGRVYDPVLSRFTSPDPIIESVYNAQTYHRYSYVQNRPLIYTDPTGYERAVESANYNYCTPEQRDWNCPNIPTPSAPTPSTPETPSIPGIDIVYDNNGEVTNINFVFENGDIITAVFDPGVDVFTVTNFPSSMANSDIYFYVYNFDTSNYHIFIPAQGLYYKDGTIGPGTIGPGLGGTNMGPGGRPGPA